MRRTKLAAALGAVAVAATMLAAPTANAHHILGPPGQTCHTLLAGPELAGVVLPPNAQGICASTLARGGSVEDVLAKLLPPLA